MLKLRAINGVKVLFGRRTKKSTVIQPFFDHEGAFKAGEGLEADARFSIKDIKLADEEEDDHYFENRSIVDLSLKQDPIVRGRQRGSNQKILIYGAEEAKKMKFPYSPPDCHLPYNRDEVHRMRLDEEEELEASGNDQPRRRSKGSSMAWLDDFPIKSRESLPPPRSQKTSGPPKSNSR